MAPTPLISLQEGTKGFSESPLFSNLSLVVSEGERLALIGDNGSGKSTLLKILAGLEELDSGKVSTRKHLQCAYIAQQDRFAESKSVGEVVDEYLAQHGLEADEIVRRSRIYLGTVGFNDPETSVATLSGGWKKRLSIACALALEPDCLLLDEPTNHLDIESIEWLEGHLASLRCAMVFVSHDRYFIERLASRVVELSKNYPRDYLSSDGSYSDYIEYRENVVSQLAQQRQSLANKVRREVEWLRAGVKARTTKAQARINEAHKLIDTLQNTPRGDRQRLDLEFSSTQRKTKELLKAERIAQSMGGTQLFSDVSLILSPGSRLAVVGPNGSGKTTFIRTLLGELPPTAGRVVRAHNIRIALMDQARTQLRDDLSLREFLCPHGDSVSFNGEQIHVAAWGARFLFSHNHLARSLGALSGGERARALLAKSMAEACDVLVFDEPTNDLDIRTLENLEEGFESFPGAIILITHDRYLLDRSASQVLGLADGKAALFGSYSQWEEYRRESGGVDGTKRSAGAKNDEKTQNPKQQTKLSYKDARDLSMIEDLIAKAEDKLASIQSEIDSGAHSTNGAKLTELCAALTTQQSEVERLYARWQELETLRSVIQAAK
jgi:ATP-binding cassette subfamily F protein uup